MTVPHSALAHFIDPDSAHTLYGLFRERLRRTPQTIAYRQFDNRDKLWRDTTWQELGIEVARWQTALAREGLQSGDRVAVMLRNCREWIIFDQAALGLGLVVVPLYTNDRPDNVCYCLEDAGVKVLLVEGDVQWKDLWEPLAQSASLQRIVSLLPVKRPDPRLHQLDDWLGTTPADPLVEGHRDPLALATIVYTSGTTGRPKGVMLSHHNILWNAWSGAHVVAVVPDDLFISFMPLSHTLERTGTYYLSLMAGCTVAFARSILQLGEDLQTLRPTAMISVPRIFEKVYGRVQDQLDKKSPLVRKLFAFTVAIGWRRFLYHQGRGGWHPGFLLWPLLDRLVAHPVREKLGGRLRVAVSGGAALFQEVAQFFVGLGVAICQGYGLTEHSPVITLNPLENNDPASVGVAIPGLEYRIGEHHELLVRSPSVMMGYWNNPEATAGLIDSDGWLHTGDQVRVQGGHFYITGRIKEILVLSNGEKVPPVDMEMAITLDPLLDQALVAGEGKSFLAAVIVVNRDHWFAFARGLGLEPEDENTLSHKTVMRSILERIRRHTRHFPGYAQIRAVHLTLEPWTVENGLITPTLKLRRSRIMEYHKTDLERLFDTF